MKMQYTEEQIARANQTDLVSFLNALRLLLFSCAWIMTWQEMRPVRNWQKKFRKGTV